MADSVRSCLILWYSKDPLRGGSLIAAELGDDPAPVISEARRGLGMYYRMCLAQGHGSTRQEAEEALWENLPPLWFYVRDIDPLRRQLRARALKAGRHEPSGG